MLREHLQRTGGCLGLECLLSVSPDDSDSQNPVPFPDLSSHTQTQKEVSLALLLSKGC